MLFLFQPTCKNNMKPMGATPPQMEEEEDQTPEFPPPREIIKISRMGKSIPEISISNDNSVYHEYEHQGFIRARDLLFSRVRKAFDSGAEQMVRDWRMYADQISDNLGVFPERTPMDSEKTVYQYLTHVVIRRPTGIAGELNAIKMSRQNALEGAHEFMEKLHYDQTAPAAMLMRQVVREAEHILGNEKTLNYVIATDKFYGIFIHTPPMIPNQEIFFSSAFFLPGK